MKKSENLMKIGKNLVTRQFSGKQNHHVTSEKLTINSMKKFGDLMKTGKIREKSGKKSGKNPEKISSYYI